MQDAHSGSKFFYYDKADRSKVIEELRDSVQSRYALLDIKKSRLGLDVDKLFSEALATEDAVTDVDNSKPDE